MSKKLTEEQNVAMSRFKAEVEANGVATMHTSDGNRIVVISKQRLLDLLKTIDENGQKYAMLMLTQDTGPENN